VGKRKKKEDVELNKRNEDHSTPRYRHSVGKKEGRRSREKTKNSRCLCSFSLPGRLDGDKWGEKKGRGGELIGKKEKEKKRENADYLSAHS